MAGMLLRYCELRSFRTLLGPTDVFDLENGKLESGTPLASENGTSFVIQCVSDRFRDNPSIDNRSTLWHLYSSLLTYADAC